MKVMFIAYHDIQIEARTQELLKCAENLGEAYFVSFSKPFIGGNSISLVTGKGRRNYRKFLLDAIKYIRKISPDIIILHDNYTAIILKWLLSIKNRPLIIYDSSELYIDLEIKKVRDYKVKFLQYFENKYLKYADIVIAANIERARIMKEYFGLKDMPLVFDNVHRISDSFNKIECAKKYDRLFNEKKFTAIYAGGINKGRMTYELADAVGKLGDKYSLIIIGNATENEKEYFRKFIEENNYSNISYLGFIPRNEFRYLLSRSKVSISAFSQDTINHKYCASGKVYESLFEGLPILTTENPPLKRLCEEHGVGVSTNNFIKGLQLLKDNYEEYSNNVRNYSSNINYNDRIKQLTEKLREAIKITSKGLI